MWLRLRRVCTTCLFLVGGFVGAFTLQMLGQPGGWDEPGELELPPSEARAFETKTDKAKTVEATAPAVAPAVQVAATPEPGGNEPAATVRGSAPSSPSSPAADDPADERPVELASDPGTRVEQLSYTALTAQSRFKRIVAISELGAMADGGHDELGQAKTALRYSMWNEDPVVAERARALYKSVSGSE